MLGRFERCEITLSRWNDEKQEMEHQEFVAKTYDEEHEILEKAYDYDDPWRVYKTKILKCSCGEEISCDSFTNTCYCGADYGFDGSRLAPREQWGEETGEHWTDCL